MDKIDFLVEKALSRRTFLAGAGSAAAATMLAGCSDDGTVTLPATSTPLTDVDILNFALNLEYLEAEFYLRAATGSGLAAADIGSSAGTVVGGTKIAGLTTAQQNILNEIAYDEQQHVRALRATISGAGATPVSRPNLDISTAFTAAATAANTLTSSAPTIPSGFNPYADFNSFLVGAFVFEDVGVTAYNGAATLITSAAYLAAASGILAVEAYHAAYVRTTLTGQAITLGSAAYPYLGYANRIGALRSALGGGAETGLTVPTGTAPYTTTIPTASAIVNADTNAIAYKRNTDQVLHIVYGTFSPTAGSTTVAAGVTKGGFFPNGLNGTISATQS